MGIGDGQEAGGPAGDSSVSVACGRWAVGGGRLTMLGWVRRHSSVCGWGVWAVASEECARVRLLPAFLADI
jgi:hypothetical protein